MKHEVVMPEPVANTLMLELTQREAQLINCLIGPMTTCEMEEVIENSLKYEKLEFKPDTMELMALADDLYGATKKLFEDEN